MLRVLNFEFMTHNHPFTPGIGQSQVLSLSPSRIPPATQPTSLMALWLKPRLLTTSAFPPTKTRWCSPSPLVKRCMSQTWPNSVDPNNFTLQCKLSWRIERNMGICQLWEMSQLPRSVSNWPRTSMNKGEKSGIPPCLLRRLRQMWWRMWQCLQEQWSALWQHSWEEWLHRRLWNLQGSSPHFTSSCTLTCSSFVQLQNLLTGSPQEVVMMIRSPFLGLPFSKSLQIWSCSWSELVLWAVNISRVWPWWESAVVAAKWPSRTWTE